VGRLPPPRWHLEERWRVPAESSAVPRAARRAAGREEGAAPSRGPEPGAGGRQRWGLPRACPATRGTASSPEAFLKNQNPGACSTVRAGREEPGDSTVPLRQMTRCRISLLLPVPGPQTVPGSPHDAVRAVASRAGFSHTARLFTVSFPAETHLKFCLYLAGHKEQARRRERCARDQESPHLLWQLGGEGEGASGERRIGAAGKGGDEGCARGRQHQHQQR